MILSIPDVLTGDELAAIRALLDGAPWHDGNATSGPQAALAKRNRQLPEDSAAARQAGEIVVAALGRSATFIAAALPLKLFPPLFNRYDVGDGFGSHVDNAVRILRGTDLRIRSDLSATLFLTDPGSYDGGGLVIDDVHNSAAAGVRLPAGHMLLYPASTLHHVAPVTRGSRMASFFWVQSMVRDGEARRMLFDLDTSIQTLAGERGLGDAAVIRLTGVYHNLLRRWADS
jgi:PKHD-type hydroxylase